MNIIIEDGIPIPEKNAGRKLSPYTEVMLVMAVGQSFFVPTESAAETKLVSTRLKARWNSATLKDRRFTSRTVEGGFRIWRVA